MTLFHFGNCLVVSCAPYLLLYKGSRLSEYQAVWKLVNAGMAYFLTQMCKMLVLATFFPIMSDGPTGDDGKQDVDFVNEFLKSTMDISDLLGIHLLMNRIPGRGELKVLIAGLGWASAEFVTTKLIPLWVGARAIEFDWKHTITSLDNNISLVLYLSVATLIWLWSRTDLQKIYMPVVALLLGLACYRPLVMLLVTYSLGLTGWYLLLFRAAYTLAIAGLSLQMYIGMVNSITTY